LPLGSYHPIFHKNDWLSAEELAAIPPKKDEPAPVFQLRFPRRLWQYRFARMALLAFAVMSGAAAIWAIWNRPEEAAPLLDLLWQPFVHQTNPIVVALPRQQLWNGAPPIL
jgi:hypothetical protein